MEHVLARLAENMYSSLVPYRPPTLDTFIALAHAKGAHAVDVKHRSISEIRPSRSNDEGEGIESGLYGPPGDLVRGYVVQLRLHRPEARTVAAQRKIRYANCMTDRQFWQEHRIDMEGIERALAAAKSTELAGFEVTINGSSVPQSNIWQTYIRGKATEHTAERRKEWEQMRGRGQVSGRGPSYGGPAALLSSLEWQDRFEATHPWDQYPWKDGPKRLSAAEENTLREKARKRLGISPPNATI